MTQDKINPELSEAQKFDKVVRTLLSVSHKEIQRRDKEWKRKRATKAKPGPKPKP
jgi:hypothetical protein